MGKLDKYFKDIERKVHILFDIANEARSKGLDPHDTVEINLATSLAERAVGLVASIYPQIQNKAIVKRIKELEQEYGILDFAVSLKIAEEIAQEKFCKFKDLLEAIDAGIRVGLAYITLGVVSSPIEGFTGLKLKKTRDGKDYFALYFSGPIRSAGGTSAAFCLVIADHLREIFGYAPYDPTDEEVKRAVTEIYDYHERVTNLQYLPTEEEAEFIARHLPLQIEGDPTEEREVSNYKDLPRVDTNRIRGGFCLVFAEGLAQKAPKIQRIVKKLRDKGFKLSDWDFLDELVELKHKKSEAGDGDKGEAVYIKDIVAGRPVFAHPSRSGGFRLIYGRARNTGYSSVAISPATMAVLENFIAVGTQLKIELPSKGGAIAVCDSIDGPVVKLDDGSVLRLNDFATAKEIARNIVEIIYLGDMLIPYGDFANRNHVLVKQGYDVSYWLAELRAVDKDKAEELRERARDIGLAEAVELSEKYGIGFHPNFIFFWTQISEEQFFSLLDWLLQASWRDKLVLPYSRSMQESLAKAKRALELLAVEHSIAIESIVLSETESKALLLNLGFSAEELERIDSEKYKKKIKEVVEKAKRLNGKDILAIVNELSCYKIMDKAGTFIGARMGRPEKAKLRKLEGSPQVLFPVGYEGGRMRSVQEACNVGSVKADFPIYYCKNCKRETIYYTCEVCGDKCEKLHYCPVCQQTFTSEKCKAHGVGQSYNTRRIDIKHYYDAALRHLGLDHESAPALVKGVRGTSSQDHVPENLAKGILRALHGLHVNKDGTIRFDATELPITHFKPKEIGTSVEKLRELGYTHDIYGKELVSEEQILEIKPHDVILPACPESNDEKADDIFVRVANFVDDLLAKFYKMKPFYNVHDASELVGHLVACIAPHNCGAVVGRIIGFSKTQALLASPYIHAAMRRDCDGDEAAVMLLLDALLNFSRAYLPAHRGGTQDAPLVLNSHLRAGEVDDMIFDLDVSWSYGLEFYRAAEEGKHPSEIKVEQISDRLGTDKEFVNIGYTHETSDINAGVLCSAYKKLVTMQDKVQKQMALVERIRAADESDVARLVIEKHFIRDIRGNLRKFSMQQFRCVNCNEKYRRPPLTGKCLRCGGKLIFTISKGSIVKYLEPALQLAKHYNVPAYIVQSLELTRSYIESIFGREREKQVALEKWF